MYVVIFHLSAVAFLHYFHASSLEEVYETWSIGQRLVLVSHVIRAEQDVSDRVKRLPSVEFPGHTTISKVLEEEQMNAHK